MKLIFTNRALQRLHKLDMTQNLALSTGDFVGCGGISGEEFELHANDSNPVYDFTFETNAGPVKIRKVDLIQLDKQNVIDFNDRQFTFVLKSERGLLNGNLNYARLPKDSTKNSSAVNG